jgi:hypothetical protein
MFTSQGYYQVASSCGWRQKEVTTLIEAGQ